MKMRLVAGFVVDLSADPDASFHPTIAAEFVEVPKSAPANLRTGYAFDGKKWTAPVTPADPDPEPAEPTYRTLMTPIRFKAQFSVMEQVAIKRARAYAGERLGLVLDILFGSLDDPRLAEVDVADAAVIGGVDFCQSIGILTAERAATIKLGVAV